MKKIFQNQPESSSKPLIKVVLLLVVIALVLWVLSLFPDLVLIILISLLLSYILYPVVKIFELRLNMRRSIAVATVFFMLFVIVGVGVAVLLRTTISYLEELYKSFSEFPFQQKLNELVLSLVSGVPFLNPQSVAEKAKSIVDAGIAGFNEIASSITGFLVNLIIVPFITYFMLLEGDTALKKLIERVPNKYFEMTLNVIYKIKKGLIGYLNGWILDSIFVGILNIVVFYVIGVPYAILLGIIAGISNLIPYIGPFFGVIPASLVSLTCFGDFRQLPYILFFSLLVIQMIDNVLIQPYCFSKTVDMHPVTVIIVLIIGNSLMGVAGMLLAIPVATILKESAVQTYWGLKSYRITA